MVEEGGAGVGGDVVEAEAAEEAGAPLLDEPDGGGEARGPAALDELSDADGEGVEEGGGVVGGLGVEVRVEARVDAVEAEEEVVGDDVGGHDPVLDGADERELEHGLGLHDVVVEDAGGVDHEEALADVELLRAAAAGSGVRIMIMIMIIVAIAVLLRGGGRGRGGDDADGGAQLARDARLDARLRGLDGVLHADVAQDVEERRLAGVGQADDEGVQAGDGVVRGGAGPEGVEDARDGARLLDVGEQDAHRPRLGGVGHGRVPRVLPLGEPPLEPGGLGPPLYREMRLGVHDEAVDARQLVLEDIVARRQRHAAVAALDHEPDVRERLAHVVERISVVAYEVGLRDIRRDLEDLARDERGFLLHLRILRRRRYI